MYAFHIDVPQPIGMYDQVMAELQRNGHSNPSERLLHVCAATETGFRITEVWDSHDALDRYGEETMRPAIEKVAGPDVVALGPPPNQEFELHGLQLRAERILP